MAVAQKDQEEPRPSGRVRPRRIRPPPEGGWGWMVVAGCFLANVCTRAVTRCVSLFFVEFQTHFGQDYSTTAWIHSLVDCTTMLCAPLGGFLGSRLSCRATIILGGVLSSAGLVISSFASSLLYLYISMGVLTGLGFSFCYTPSVAMVGTYFSERKALAFGIAMSGSGIGTFVLAPVVQMLIQLYTWRGALLILGGFVSNLCVCGALMKPLGDADEEESETTSPDWSPQSLGSKDSDQVPAADGSPLEMKIKLNNLQDMQWLISTNGGAKLKESDGVTRGLDVETEQRSKEDSSRGSLLCLRSSPEFGFLLMPDFLMLAVSVLLMAYGCSAPIVHLVPYALSVGVGHQHAAFLMSIFGVSVIVGNVTFGWITDRKCLKKYPLLCYMLGVGCDGLCCMFVPLLHSFPLLVPFVIFYGYFEGAYVALIPVVASDVTGPNYLSSSLGVVYFLHAIPFLISPPIGGWLVDRTGTYTSTFLLCGSCFLCSALVVSLILLRRYRRSKCQKRRVCDEQKII